MKHALARIWQTLPIPLRRRIVRLTQTSFTVGVSSVVLFQNNQVLLLRHRFREADSWELPGGFVKRNEDLEDAVRRELREETGPQVQVLSIVAGHVNKPQQLDICFLAIVTGGTIRIDPREILAASFFPTNELPLDLDPNVTRTINAALTQAHRPSQ